MAIAFIVSRCSMSSGKVHPDEFNPYRRRRHRGIPLIVNARTEAILDACSVSEKPQT
jgi:hypothetical protein